MEACGLSPRVRKHLTPTPETHHSDTIPMPRDRRSSNVDDFLDAVGSIPEEEEGDEIKTFSTRFPGEVR